MKKELLTFFSILAVAGLVACTGSESEGPVAESAEAMIDKDHDGVPDYRDRCPNTAQIKKVAPDFKYKAALSEDRYSPEPKSWPVNADGCEPDDDNDGVVNSKDFCPSDTPEMLVAGVAANGCPKQSDGDGTPDYRDKCPGTPFGVKTDKFGCPVGSN